MDNIFSLVGKKILVVGGAGDLGRAMVDGFVEAGAVVAVIDIRDEVFELASCNESGRHAVYPFQADIMDREQIRSSYQHVMEVFNGKIDVLLNSAGIQRRSPSEIFPEKDWDDVLAVNLSATFFYCQLAAQAMITEGYGKIINVASMQSFCGGITIPAYSASKGGVAMLTKTLANDWGYKGLNVNAIAPGYMDTELNAAIKADSSRSTEILSRIPQRRWSTGEDLKGVSIFLASAASDYVNGAIIPVDGGYLGR